MINGQKTGYLQVYGEGANVERDVLTCNHCQQQIIVRPDKGADSPKMRLDRCGQCFRTICPKCAEEMTRTVKCAPFERRLEEIERNAALLKAAGA